MPVRYKREPTGHYICLEAGPAESDLRERARSDDRENLRNRTILIKAHPRLVMSDLYILDARTCGVGKQGTVARTHRPVSLGIE